MVTIPPEERIPDDLREAFHAAMWALKDWRGEPEPDVAMP
jgi:hypothetical protein